MKHVMPTLTQALIDCCKVRPDDPIDFLVSLSFPTAKQTNKKKMNLAYSSMNMLIKSYQCVSEMHVFSVVYLRYRIS